MKNTRKILAALLCLCLLIACASISAVAATATGSITVQDQSGTNATVAGKTLNLFQIFRAETDASGNTAYFWIEETDGTNRYESFFFGDEDPALVDDNGDPLFPNLIGKESGTIFDVVTYISTMESNSYELSQMAANLHTYIHAKNIGATDSKDVETNKTSHTFEGLDLGYYMVYDATVLPTDSPAVRSAAMLAQSGENVTIELKADRPHIAKYVDDDKADGEIDDLGTTASIGDTVKFRIATMIPNHKMYGNQYSFIITDTMADGLAYVDGSISVVLTEPGQTPVTLTNDGVNANIATSGLADGIDLKVKLLKATEIDQDSTLEITYEATVLTTAVSVNVNTATLTYSNDPNNTDSKGTVNATANVMVWQTTLTKFMESAEGIPTATRIAGAEFQIFKKEGGVVAGDPMTFTVTDVDGADYKKYVYNPAADTAEASTTTTLKTYDDSDDADHYAQIKIFGLGEGTYVIRETKAPTGYFQATGDFEFTVTDTIGPAGLVADAAITPVARETGVPGQFTRVAVNEDTLELNLGITNRPSAALPGTGGMGTTLFIVVGVIMMAGALAFFTSRKRSRAV